MGFDKNFNPILRFMVLSDIHYEDKPSVERERMARALECAYSLCDNDKYNRLDAIYVVGDFATSGSDIQMNAFKATLDEYVREGTVVNCSIASHEFHCPEGEDGAKRKLKEIFGMEPSTHKIINGFHFVSIGCTGGCHFKSEERDFAFNALEEARKDNPQKPVFVFQHPHITDTVYGSINWGEDELTDIFVNFPQIIDFSGHSHAPINDPRSINQRHFTCLGTGTLSYFELDEFDKITGTLPPDKAQAAQFLFVEADENGRVRIYPYDVITENFFPYVWKIDEPWNQEKFIYTDERYHNPSLPYFEEGTPVNAKRQDKDVIVSFGQGKGDERVNYYEVILLDEKGRTVRKQNLFSSYYLYDFPKTIKATFENAPKEGCRVKIYANGFWKNRSRDYLYAEVL